MKVRAFITHKLCEQYADCQDRFCINPDNRRIGLSDGMSQSIFPNYWAELLSKQYANEGHCNEKDRKKLCDSWMQRVIKYREEQISKGKDPWRLDNFIAAHKGAGATICGVSFDNATDWKGDVLGDSCIVKVNTKDWDVETLTSEDKAFDSYPDFYDSFPEKAGRGTLRSFEGRISPDDILLLVSDPFSDFIAKNQENAQGLIEQILSLDSHEGFCKLVDEWRAKGMHNDDSTLCIVEFDNNIVFDVKHQDSIEELIERERSAKENEETRLITTANVEESNKPDNNLSLNNENEKKSDDCVANKSETVHSVRENIVENTVVDGCLNDKLEETHNWILGKIDDLLKCSKNNTKGFLGKWGEKIVVNRTIPTYKVEKLREDIEMFFDQLRKR